MTFIGHVAAVALVVMPAFGLQTLCWARALKRIDRRLSTIEEEALS